MDTYDFLADPRALSLEDRHLLKDRLQQEHDAWFARLAALAEDCRPEPDFPAFLLATQPFADLAQKLARVTRRQELGSAVADELDWFLRAFEGYLRTCDGEDVFVEPPLTA